MPRKPRSRICLMSGCSNPETKKYGFFCSEACLLGHHEAIGKAPRKCKNDGCERFAPENSRGRRVCLKCLDAAVAKNKVLRGELLPKVSKFFALPEYLNEQVQGDVAAAAPNQIPATNPTGISSVEPEADSNLGTSDDEDTGSAEGFEDGRADGSSAEADVDEGDDREAGSELHNGGNDNDGEESDGDGYVDEDASSAENSEDMYDEEEPGDSAENEDNLEEDNDNGDEEEFEEEFGDDEYFDE